MDIVYVTMTSLILLNSKNVDLVFATIVQSVQQYHMSI